ncbi:MAG: hypothetical protein ACREV9_13990, partial [Burkholderiales bacterium]
LKGERGDDHPVMEHSQPIDTPDGIVLVVWCSHPTIEKIVEAAKTAINKPVHLLVGGTHLLPAKDDDIQRIAASLKDNVKWLAAAHCTGEPAFAILQKTFGDRYLYAGVGTLLPLGKGGQALRGEAARLAGDDLANYREFARWSHDAMDFKLAQADRDNAH